jgi:hypothetical protein
MSHRALAVGCFFLAGLTLTVLAVQAQTFLPTADSKPTPPPAATPSPGQAAASPNADVTLVERVIAARKEYQASLEALYSHYTKAKDQKRAKWAEEELVQYHRIDKGAYRLELVMPPPKMPPATNIPEANELYKQAMTFKEKGWGNDYNDNQRRAEILFQRMLKEYPESDKRSDAAYQLGDLYESKTFKQYQLAATCYERCFQWNSATQLDARIRAARLYDKVLVDRKRAEELYREVTLTETDPKRLAEANKRLAELGQGK